MQYAKCNQCIHQGYSCRMIMAQAMSLFADLEYLIEYSQTRQTNHICKLKIDYDCENFTPLIEELNNEK